jgi:hypothetical protein
VNTEQEYHEEKSWTVEEQPNVSAQEQPEEKGEEVA